MLHEARNKQYAHTTVELFHRERERERQAGLRGLETNTGKTKDCETKNKSQFA